MYWRAKRSGINVCSYNCWPRSVIIQIWLIRVHHPLTVEQTLDSKGLSLEILGKISWGYTGCKLCLKIFARNTLRNKKGFGYFILSMNILWFKTQNTFNLTSLPHIIIWSTRDGKMRGKIITKLVLFEFSHPSLVCPFQTAFTLSVGLAI